MNNRQVLELNDALRVIGNKAATARFNFAVAMNRRAIKSAVESLQETIKLPETLQEHERKKNAIGMRYALLDEKTGKPVRTASGGIVLRDGEAYKVEMDRFKVEHAEAERQLQAKVKEADALLDADCPDGVKLVSVDLSEVPDGIIPDVFEALLPMINLPA
jgi:hypothetical protein